MSRLGGGRVSRTASGQSRLQADVSAAVVGHVSVEWVEHMGVWTTSCRQLHAVLSEQAPRDWPYMEQSVRLGRSFQRSANTPYLTLINLSRKEFPCDQCMRIYGVSSCAWELYEEKCFITRKLKTCALTCQISWYFS